MMQKMSAQRVEYPAPLSHANRDQRAIPSRLGSTIDKNGSSTMPGLDRDRALVGAGGR
jgi:hypothetical protein